MKDGCKVMLKEDMLFDGVKYVRGVYRVKWFFGDGEVWLVDPHFDNMCIIVNKSDIEKVE